MANVINNRSQVHLIVPDSHAHPEHSNERYDWLADLILDIKPDVVVDIGDFWDMPSLCSYDKGTKGFEGRRYKKDIEAGIEAQDRLYTKLRRAKRKLPRFVRTLGNHENRINRAVERDGVLDGVLSTKDLMSKEYGWEEHAFLEPVVIDGVTYSHYFISGIMGRPIGGLHHAYSLLAKQHESCTQGHSHLFDYCIQAAGPRKIHGLVCGVFIDYVANFAGPANGMWNSGVVIKRNVENGMYDLQHVSIEALRNEYGK